MSGGYKVAWSDGSLELQTKMAAIHLANSFREEGREAIAYFRASAESEWTEMTE